MQPHTANVCEFDQARLSSRVTRPIFRSAFQANALIGSPSGCARADQARGMGVGVVAPRGLRDGALDDVGRGRVFPQRDEQLPCKGNDCCFPEARPLRLTALTADGRASSPAGCAATATPARPSSSTAEDCLLLRRLARARPIHSARVSAQAPHRGRRAGNCRSAGAALPIEDGRTLRPNEIGCTMPDCPPQSFWLATSFCQSGGRFPPLIGGS